jgi:menaquinol-cytochrome c reductase iron-sulfur subunit
VTLAGISYVALGRPRRTLVSAELSMDPGPPTEVLPPRRRFLARLSIALSAAIAAAAGIPVIGFLISPLTRKAPRVWRPVGAVSQFQIGETVNVAFEDASPLPWAGVTARSAAWLRRDDAQHFTAFTVHCTHLGCPVRWVATAKLFLCPCHGGVYYPDGSRAAGPPPKPLPQYPVRVRNGQVEILTSPIPIV